MSEPTAWRDRPDDCSTTNSFRDHHIVDGVDLLTRTYYRLRVGADPDFSPTESFFDGLESAFVGAYLESVEESTVPRHVEIAIEDARALTAEEFSDRPDAGLRTEIIPAFYRRVAEFHCRYRD